MEARLPGGPASAEGLAIDSAAKTYSLPTRSNQRIEKLRGIITTVAGNGVAGYAEMAACQRRRTYTVPQVFVSMPRYLYIADRDNNRFVYC